MARRAHYDNSDQYNLARFGPQWSPQPQAFYTRAGMPNEWAKDLDTPAWNLTWASLEDPQYIPAPRSFRDKLEQSLACAYDHHGSVRLLRDEAAKLDPAQGLWLLLESEASHWIGAPPLLLQLPGVRNRWYAKVLRRVADTEADFGPHPVCFRLREPSRQKERNTAQTQSQQAQHTHSVLNHLMDKPMTDVTAAQSLLTQIGLLRR